MAERSQRKRDKGWRMPEGAVYVGRPSKWGSPFKVGTYRALARYPSVDHPGKEWEYEGRVSADGMRHDYHHPGGEPLRIPEHPSAPALIDQAKATGDKRLLRLAERAEDALRQIEEALSAWQDKRDKIARLEAELAALKETLKRKSPTGIHGEFPCPECGKVCATAGGRGSHRANAHGYRAGAS